MTEKEDKVVIWSLLTENYKEQKEYIQKRTSKSCMEIIWIGLLILNTISLTHSNIDPLF